MKIKDVQKDLLGVAGALDQRAGALDQEAGELRSLSGRIRVLCDELNRRKPAKRAPTVSRRMTPELAEEVRRTVERNPDMTMHQVSVLHGVNQGRVSEAVRGKRT